MTIQATRRLVYVQTDQNKDWNHRHVVPIYDMSRFHWEISSNLDSIEIKCESLYVTEKKYLFTQRIDSTQFYED